MMVRRASILTALLIVGCGPGGGGGGGHGGTGGGGGTLTTIDVSPTTVTLTTLGGGAVAAQQFTATGHFSDGHSEDVTASAGWTVSDPGIGQVARRRLHRRGHARRRRHRLRRQGRHLRLGDDLRQVRRRPRLGRRRLDRRRRLVRRVQQRHRRSRRWRRCSPTRSTAPSCRTTSASSRCSGRSRRAPPISSRSRSRAPTLDYKVYTNASLPAGFRLSLTPAEWSSIADSTQRPVVDDHGARRRHRDAGQGRHLATVHAQRRRR